MYMLVAFLALLAFLGGVRGKSAKNVECAKGYIESELIHNTVYTYATFLLIVLV